MNSSSTSKRIGKSAVWSFAENFSRQVLAMLVFFITARFVSQEAFGVMAISYLVVEAFRLIVIDSVGTAVTAKENPTDKDYNACFVIIALGCGVSAAVVYGLAGMFANLVNDPAVQEALHYLCLVLLTLGLSRTHEAWLVRHFQFKILAIRSVLSILIGGGVGIYMAVQGYGLLALIAQQLVTSVIAVILLWSTCEWKPSFRTQWLHIKDILQRAKFIALGNGIGLGNTQIDTFFSSYYFGPASVGIYNAAKRIVYALNAIISTSMDKVALSVFADLQSEGASRANAFLLAISITSFVTAPMMAGISALSPELVHILLGNKWADAAPILSILMISAYLLTLAIYGRTIFLVNNRTHWLTTLGCVGLICNIILFISFARHGLLVVASLIVLREIVFVMIALVIASSLLKISVILFFRAFLTSAISSLLMWISLWHLRSYVDGWGDVLIILTFIPVGAVVYLLSMLILDRAKMRECYKLFQFLRSKKNNHC